MSALLTVGIDSSQGKSDVLAFRDFVQKNLGNIKFDINTSNLSSIKLQVDEAALEASLTKALGSAFVLNIDSDALVKTVRGALASAFSQEYEVKISTGRLTQQVSAAIKAGMGGDLAGGTTIHTNTGAVGGTVTPSMLAEAVRSGMTPLVDKIDLMTKSTEGGMRQGRRTATISESARTDGVSVSTKTSVAPDEARSLVAQVKAQNDQAKQEADDQKAADRSLVIAQKAQEDKDTYIRKAEADQDAWENARQRERDAAFAAMDKQSAAERAADLRTMAAEDQALIDGADDAWLQHEKASRAELLAQQKAANTAAIAETQAYLDEQESILKIAQSMQLAAQEKAADERTAVMKAEFEKNKLAASDQYSGKGPSIVASQKMQETHGTPATQQFLGSQQYLLQMTDALSGYEKVAKDTTETTKALKSGTGELIAQMITGKQTTGEAASAYGNLTSVMDESHSAVRGLAGSLGAMWVTWGSVIPLIAGAAIGGALKSVISIGKDVEDQLVRVAAVTGSTAVSVKDFGEAVRGSLMMPKDAAEGMATLAQSGMSVSDSLKALPDVLRLASIGAMSVSDAATAATGVMRGFGLSVEDLGHITDVIAKSSSSSGQSIADMSNSMKDASEIASVYHVSLEETAATMETLAKGNITGTAAVSSFKKIVEGVATPTATAQKAITALGLSFYDATTKQLKPFSEILTEIKDRTDLLNDKSKLNLLENMFGEKGTKGIQTILDQFTVFGSSLDTIKTKSDGFAESMQAAFSEDTNGKIKSLMSDFELSAVNSFGGASVEVNHFIETLRGVVDNQSFGQAITALVNNIAALGTILTESSGIIVYGGVAWAGYKLVVGGVQSAMLMLEPTLAAAAVEQEALTAATYLVAAGFVEESVAAEAATAAVAESAAALSLATFGFSAILALILPLIVNWVLFTDHTDELTKSLNASGDALKNRTAELEKERVRLDESNVSLAYRNSLMIQGKTLEEANAADDARKSGKKNTETKDTLTGNLNKAQSAYDEAKGNVDNSGFNENGNDSDLEAFAKASAQLDQAKDELKQFNAAVKVATDNTFSAAAEKTKQATNALLIQVQNFNAAYDKIKNNKDYHGPQGLNVKVSTGESNDDIAANLKSSQDAMNAGKQTVTIPTAGNNGLEHAQTAGVEAKVKADEAAQKELFTFTQQLGEKELQEFTGNAQVKAAILDAMYDKQVTQAEELTAISIMSLKAEQDKYAGQKGGDAEIKRIQNVIDARQRDLDDFKTKLNQKKELSDQDAVNSKSKDDYDTDKSLNSSRVSAAKGIQDIQDTASNKQISPRDAAGNTAFTNATNSYAAPLEAANTSLKAAYDELDKIDAKMTEVTDSGGDWSAELIAAKAVNQTIVDQEQKKADLIAAEALKTATIAKTTATTVYDQSQTAQAGWDTFWTKWSADATSNAKIVESVLGTAFNGISTDFANFVTTGKFNFRSLVADIIAQAAKALASKELSSLVSIGMSLFSAYMGTDSGTAGTGGVSIDGTAYNNPSAYVGGGKATGGQVGANAIMPVNENGPELYTYQGGQYLMAGASGGRITPLSNAYQGTSGTQTTSSSSGGNQNNANISITIASDGKSKVTSDGSGNSAAQLGRMLQNAVITTINEQQRPGGALYPMKKQS